MAAEDSAAGEPADEDAGDDAEEDTK